MTSPKRAVQPTIWTIVGSGVVMLACLAAGFFLFRAGSLWGLVPAIGAAVLAKLITY